MGGIIVDSSPILIPTGEGPERIYPIEQFKEQIDKDLKKRLDEFNDVNKTIRRMNVNTVVFKDMRDPGNLNILISWITHIFKHYCIYIHSSNS